MKIVRFSTSSKTQYGILEGTSVNGLKTSPFEDGWNINNLKLDGSNYTLDKITLLTPCVPGKYIGIGINYKSSVIKSGRPAPETPIIFYKPPTAVIGTGAEIIFPLEQDAEVVYEGELGVVIGKKCKKVKQEDALIHVLGYTCANDVTDRIKFKVDKGNDVRAKGADTFGPIGPCISTDIDPGNVEIRTWLNGELRQQGNSSDMIFNVPFLIAYLSNFMTLLPGDVIATGTPAGNIMPVQPGDVVKVEIEGIGTLENTFVSHR
jgi:2-keto-4-pentenoate hydratase/2-oxohepta-3-ene-1,7-dioic acid hydratase in catechol pathway